MKPLWRACVSFLLARQGRLVALLFLALASLALPVIDQTPLAPLRNNLFDRYQHDLPRDRSALPALVVAIDEASLRQYGQWPWNRQRVAQLVERIGQGRPLAIGLDILFAEQDRYSPERLLPELPPLTPTQRAALPDPDRRLAEALDHSPSVLAVSGIDAGTPGAHALTHAVPTHSPNPRAMDYLPVFGTALGSLPALESRAKGQGLINAAPDTQRGALAQGVLRRVPLAARIGQGIVPNLGLEMVRQALGGQPIDLEADAFGLTALGVGDYHLPTQPDGSVFLHFGRFQGDCYLSAADVLAGRIDPAQFQDRFVLIGLTGLGLVDSVVTPVGEKVPGIDVHAQIIESLLSGEAARRPAWMTGLELAVLIVAGLGLIVAVPTLRPIFALGLGSLLSLGLMAAGYGAFAAGRWLFDSASLVVLLNPLFISLLGNTLVAADRRRRQAEKQLQASREAAAHMAGELDAARRIQLGMLPDPAQVVGQDQRFDLGALLEPAREVGGDFYECFKLDADHLCLAVGDVSGKGLPASLFMAVSKTLTGALTRHHGGRLGQALSEVERELNRENPEMLFVTAFVAILDLETGALECACAGHEPPLRRRGATVERLDTSDWAGPPLGALGDYIFTSATLQLAPGDRLCLFTDGLTEAARGDELFGHDRLIRALSEGPEGESAGQTAQRLRQLIRRHEAGQPPSDDFTVLVVDWHGPSSQGA